MQEGETGFSNTSHIGNLRTNCVALVIIILLRYLFMIYFDFPYEAIIQLTEYC